MEEERIQRVQQFLRGYTEEGDGYRVSYITLKHRYFSWCESIGLRGSSSAYRPAPDTYNWQELYEVLYTRYPPPPSGFKANGGVVGLRMKHPIGLPRYYPARKGIPKHVKDAVYAKFASEGRVCALCGDLVQVGEKTHIDHIVPYRDGGRDDLSNLQVVHERCNLGKG